MIQSLLIYGLLILSGSLVSLSAMAAKNASYCSLDGNNPSAQIEGIHANERLPIGSVSKLVTTYWALSALKPSFKFATRIYIMPIADKDSSTVDIHFEGSRDPYFGKESLHYLISELNKMKIFNVRNLTFDSNFKFFWNVSGGQTMSPGMPSVETGYYGPDAPSADTVTTELKKFRKNLAYGYATTRNHLNKLGLQLETNARLSAQNIKFVPSEEFTAPENSIVRMIYSSSIIPLLKEMNRNSNNHSANQIFEYLGGAEKFQEFINQDGLSDNQILFVNGHGNRKNIDVLEAVYNEASCEAILKILSQLRVKLQAMNMDMDDVLAVPGVDQNSTLGAYEKKSYADSLAAKTGTIGPAVTLAGMLLSNDGPIYFMYNMATEGTRRDWSKARSAIAVQLSGLAKKSNGGIPFDSQQVKFVAFDPELFFHEDDMKENPMDAVINPEPGIAQVNSKSKVVSQNKAVEFIVNSSTATIKQIGPNFNVIKKKKVVLKNPPTEQPAPPVAVASPPVEPTQPLKTYKMQPPAPPKKARVVAKKSSSEKKVAVHKAKSKSKSKSKNKVKSVLS